MAGMFGGRASNSVQQEIYAGIQVSTSQYGQPIPIVGGRQRIPFTLGWFGNFKATANNQGGGKGGGGGGNKTYTYSTSFIAFLALGPIQGVNKIWHDKSLQTLSSENLTLFLGATGQPTWTGYPASTPVEQKIPYSNYAYVATPLFDLGSSASMPNLTLEVEGSVPSFSPSHGMFDCDLTAMIPYYLSDPIAGAGFQGTIQNLQGTTNTVQSYCMSLGLTASPYENTQRAATDFVKELLQIMNCECFLSVGQFKILPLGDQPVSATTPDGTAWSWAPNLTPVFSFTDDHYVPQQGEPPVKLTQKALNAGHNMLNVEYVDRTNYYNTASVNASLINDIALTGPRLMSTATLHQITNAQTALMVAQLMLQADRYELNTLEFRVRQDFCQVEPLDYISVTDSGLGYAGQVCRVLEVEDDRDDVLIIKALEIPGVVRSSAQYNWNSASGYFANYAATPGSVLTPVIFQMPPIAQALDQGIAVGIAVAPSASSVFWLGCHAWMSVDGGNTYFRIGTINTPARYGTITANISAVADPDTTSTLSIALADTNLQMSTAVTHAEADSNQTLILIGSGSTAEIMSYGAATLTGTGTYNLSYLRRNLYGSSNQGHTSGATFVRIDGNLFQITIDPGYAGKILNFKFTSFNTWSQAEEDIAGVTSYSYTVPSANSIGGAIALLPRGSAALSGGGSVVYKADGSATAWDSDAVSLKAYPQASISGQFGSGNFSLWLTSSVATTVVPGSNADFSITARVVTGNVQVYEGTNLRVTVPGTPVFGDAYDIVDDGFNIRYYINGFLVWTTPSQGGALYAGASLFSAGSVIDDVAADYGAAATPSQWVSGTSCAVNDTNASKVSGVLAFDGNSWVASLTGYKACHITFKPSKGSVSNVLFGLATASHVSSVQAYVGTSAHTFVDYAWNVTGTVVSDGKWRIFESGSGVATFAVASSSDVAWISYDGTNVRYYLNDPTSPVRTVSAPGLTLFGLGVMEDVGAAVDSLRMAPGGNLALIDTGQVGIDAASQIISATSGTFFITCSVSGVQQDADGTSITIQTHGYPIGIDFMCDVQASSAGNGHLTMGLITIRRDGTDIGSAQFDVFGAVTTLAPAGNVPFAGKVTLTATDTPSAGSHTYTVHVKGTAAGTLGSYTISCSTPSMKIREYKR